MTTIQSFNNIIKLATAIAEFEGYFKNSTRAHRNNNPGNIRATKKAQKQDSQGFRIYSDAWYGWTALLSQILLNVARGLTLSTFFAGNSVYPGYAPGEQSRNYIEFVKQKTGFESNVPLEYYISLT